MIEELHKNTYSKQQAFKIIRLSLNKYFKTHLWLSYKGIRSRIIQKESVQMKLKRIMFWIKYANLTNEDIVIANVDETVINNHTKRNYSWSIKDQAANVENINLNGSLSLIASITSKGNWHYCSLISNNNSQELNQLANNNFLIHKTRRVLHLDNSLIHHSKVWLEYLNKLRWIILFLASYSPEYAPIELLFLLLKRSPIDRSDDDLFKLKTNREVEIIEEWMKNY